ncbi:hypothetical protein SAMN06295937_102149 [Sphingopyxis flava]|uniref:Uncharacterized protein n=2 Tax=Sphingopyxis flava TaxID=1507287 RepID=A0A1T5EFQ9_9SPHN|nr:hypothetical protein SAMN06295937_102149 [Sphingopyxis flava]
MDLDQFRSSAASIAAPVARPLFRLTTDLDLPPLPGHAAASSRHSMANLLEELIDAAGCNEIPAPARAPDQPSIVDLFGALKTAAAGFEVAPGVGLAEHFWTHPVALHNGEAAASLLRTARNGHSIHGFAVLYATDVRPPLLYGPNMSPLRVTGTVGTESDIEGPYLALVAFEGEPDGRAAAIEAYAAPIFHARRFILVRSELDRDVLRALEHLQAALDAHGVECAIHRVRPGADDERTLIELVISNAVGGRRMRLAIDATREATRCQAERTSPGFVVTHRNWRDGSFIAWLAQTVIADGRTIPAIA